MPETLFHRDFSAGWCPSDDPVNGRPNALLQMDNVELDKNGALQLIHGSRIIYTGYSGVAYTLFSRFIGGTRYDYAALNDGSVYRNNTQIITGGDNSNAAFETAFNFTLICSGSKRYKDTGTSLSTLGVSIPTAAPIISQSEANAPWAIIGSMQTNIAVAAGQMAVISGNYDQCTTDTTGLFVMQSNFATPNDCTILSSVGGSGTATDDDFVLVNGYTPDPYGVSLQYDVLLAPGDSAGDPVTDFYSYVVQDLATQAQFDTITGQFTLKIARSDFSRIGGAATDWSKVYGFRLTIRNNKNASSIINIWGPYMGQSLFVIQGGTAAQFGTYQYAQVNVNNTGSYLAKSTIGPLSKPVTLNGVTALVTYQVPTDPQVNEVWIFRQGGNLNNWYRVLVIKAPFTTNPIYDGMGDQAALTLDITIDPNLVSIASITDKIYDIVGPIQGRWFYFTTNFMYPSDINDPDLVNPSVAVRTTGSVNEQFMWARNVSASVVVVGTSVDCYLLTGTFSTFPDGTIDIYYQPLGVKFPPVTYDAVPYGGSIYYLGADGWRVLIPTSFGTTYSAQNNQLIVAPNLDRLYKGESCYGYPPAQMPVSPGAQRFALCVGKNKLWCFPFGTGRCEVYDFVRQYWRTFNFNLGDVGAAVATQDNAILAFYDNDKTLREVDYPGSKLIDGTRNQTFKILFPYKDNGKPRQRKDSYTFKARCYTGSGFIYPLIYDEKSTSYGTYLLSAPGLVSQEVFSDLSQSFGNALPKTYQVQLGGNLDDMCLEDWSIQYDARPEPITYLYLYPSNLGSATQKRLRTWPMIIDTLGNNVTFTPIVDGVKQSTTIWNSTFKQTLFHYFTDDVFGIDYGGTLLCAPGGEMEIYDTGLQGGLMPDIVQALPIQHKFDQVGPFEAFRYGKIVRMALRTQSAGTPIPFKIYSADSLIYQSQFNVTPGVEDEYVVDLPKGVSGRILRVELGPTGATFSRYYVKFQVAISGKDTELAWVTIPGITGTLAGGI